MLQRQTRAKQRSKPIKQPFEQAELNLSYTKIKAPIDGYVTKLRRCGWKLPAGRPGVNGAGAAAGMGNRQFQGNATAQYAAGTTSDYFGGCLRGPQIAGTCRQHSSRQRSGVQFVTAGKRDRQLRESSPARAGEDRARRSTADCNTCWAQECLSFRLSL